MRLSENGKVVPWLLGDACRFSSIITGGQELGKRENAPGALRKGAAALAASVCHGEGITWC